ncbi:hypothetical protein O0I10_002925 [Lichtheimia ornata]|uniref:GLTSCR protein conserved domain-containing protein n=1 Tax=Lichtheimia ornata TaxID=688661 RepID=A0AAD7Y2L0_9FUNG|nr:uncharacterized protein O0I10_002925 [Lichtheimia ornata]KAJ8661177.1 hypothetical protein O0I10_002925 [Lichtheimia ornata]
MSQQEGNRPSTQIKNGAADEEIITQITLAGLKVIMLRKGDQIIYKLPDNVPVQSLADDQRERLLQEIQKLHAATLAAATRNATGGTGSSATNEQGGNKTIAPKHNGISAPLPSSPDPDALKETARKLREEYEREQQKQQPMMIGNMPETTSSSSSSMGGSIKTTRKYVKTGKYSKKRLHHPHQLAAASSSSGQLPLPPHPQHQQHQQQHQQSAPPLIALHHMVAQQPQQQQQPIPPNFTLPSHLATKSILAKRLPEEELHHQDVKRRIYDSILSDHKAVTEPDYKTPFRSKQDVIDRLLPYHIYQYPKVDMDANKIPMDKQDQLTMEIFKSQAELFKRFSDVCNKVIEGRGIRQLQIMLERQLLADQRQRLTEEQARVAAEQAAIQQAEAQQRMSEQNRMASGMSNYMAAILQNPQILNQYSQLSPEQQQKFLQNQEQIVALLEQHAKELNSKPTANPTHSNVTSASNTPTQQPSSSSNDQA